MPLGAETSRTTISTTDTAELVAYVYEDNDTAAEGSDLSGVEFTILYPDQTRTTVAGDIQPDGSGFYRFTDTVQLGLYLWTAQFTFTSGEKRTYRDEFQVVDPLDTAPVSQASEIGEQVWMRIEDCFDSEEGGPWLRDMTLAWFEPAKVERFIPEGLMRINTWPPHTQLDLSYFTTQVINPDPNLPTGTLQPDPDRIVIVQATLLSTIKHLMRSYVEQPDIRAQSVNYQDRRDYLQRWQSIYTIEAQEFKEMVALWKRQFINLGHGALLTHSKAGRLYGPYMRPRNAMRGWG